MQFGINCDEIFRAFSSGSNNYNENLHAFSSGCNLELVVMRFFMHFHLETIGKWL